MTNDLQPIYREIDRIAESAAEREANRLIDPSVVSGLKKAGFGKLRVPRTHGGFGLSLKETFPILRALATADSNIAQALRPHFLAVEKLLISEESPHRTKWLRTIGTEVVLIGNALTEKSNPSDQLQTTLTASEDSDEYILNGKKFYSTGSLYADYIQVLAVDDEGNDGQAFIARDAPGVTLIDDWDGFGQKLTASGSSVFESVPVDPTDIQWTEYTAPSAAQALAQAHHLSTLTGIARAVVNDLREYVSGRTRVFSTGNGVLPQDDPQVQQIVGQAESTAYSVEAIFDHLVDHLDRIHAGYYDGTVTEEELAAVDLAAAKAQLTIAPLVLRHATDAFEVGGASAVNQGRGLDRHWRNARVLASHNPLIYRAKLVGSAVLHGGHEARQYTVGQAS